jgi:hypothetical protein
VYKAQGFNPGKHSIRAVRPERARDHLGQMRFEYRKGKGICWAEIQSPVG